MGCGKTHLALEMIEKNTIRILTKLLSPFQHFEKMIPIMVRSGSKGMMMFGLLSLMTVSINGFESCYSCYNSLRYYLLLMISLLTKILIREGRDSITIIHLRETSRSLPVASDPVLKGYTRKIERARLALFGTQRQG